MRRFLKIIFKLGFNNLSFVSISLSRGFHLKNGVSNGSLNLAIKSILIFQYGSLLCTYFLMFETKCVLQLVIKVGTSLPAFSCDYIDLNYKLVNYC